MSWRPVGRPAVPDLQLYRVDASGVFTNEPAARGCAEDLAVAAGWARESLDWDASEHRGSELMELYSGTTYTGFTVERVTAYETYTPVS